MQYQQLLMIVILTMEKELRRSTRLQVVALPEQGTVTTEPPPSKQDRDIARFRRENEKASRSGVLKKAVDLVLSLKAANGGKSKYGVIKKVVEQYNSIGYDFVTRGSLCYHLSVTNDSTRSYFLIPEAVVVGVQPTNEGDQQTELSLLTDPHHDQQEQNEEVHERVIGGRKKGATNAAKMLLVRQRSEAIEKAANLLIEERLKAKAAGTQVKNGTCARIIKMVESASSLPPGSMKWKTVVSRADRNNPSGKAPQRTTPLEDVEPIIVEYCIRLAKMGSALTKFEVISLASPLLKTLSTVLDLSNLRKIETS
jgi:hypothetical protein